jgi:hypothetical protein
MEGESINYCFIFYVRRFGSGEDYRKHEAMPLTLTYDKMMSDLAKEYPRISEDIEKYKKEAKTKEEIEGLLVDRRIECFKKSRYKVFKVVVCEKQGSFIRDVGLL